MSLKPNGKITEPGAQFEPMIAAFVDAQTAANFLCISRRRVLEMARAGQIPAHPIGCGKRKIWRFRLSELADAFVAEKPDPGGRNRGIINLAVPGNRIGGIR